MKIVLRTLVSFGALMIYFILGTKKKVKQNKHQKKKEKIEKESNRPKRLLKLISYMRALNYKLPVQRV